MRRRRARYGDTPESLRPEALPDYVDDLSAPLATRLARWDAWMREYEAWQDARAAWVGDDLDLEARLSFDAGNLIPDAPFDPSAL